MSFAIHNILIVRLRIPEHPVFNRVLPRENRIGTMLLSRIIDIALAGENQLLQGTARSGELNSSLFICAVENKPIAIEILKRELLAFFPMAVFKIACFDERELVWRTIVPTPNETVDFLDDLFAELQISTALTQALRDAEKEIRHE